MALTLKKKKADPLAQAHARTGGALGLFHDTVEELESVNEEYHTIADQAQDVVTEHLARREDALATAAKNAAVVDKIRALLT